MRDGGYEIDDGRDDNNNDDTVLGSMTVRAGVLQVGDARRGRRAR